MALLFPDYEPRHKSLTKAMVPLENLSRGMAGYLSCFPIPTQRMIFLGSYINK